MKIRERNLFSVRKSVELFKRLKKGNRRDRIYLYYYKIFGKPCLYTEGIFENPLGISYVQSEPRDYFFRIFGCLFLLQHHVESTEWIQTEFLLYKSLLPNKRYVLLRSVE